jgi:hypothetical protein
MYTVPLKSKPYLHRITKGGTCHLINGKQVELWIVLNLL